MDRITPLSRQVYGKRALRVRDKTPDAKYWQAYETKLYGQYFLRSVMEIVTERVEEHLPRQGRILDLMCGMHSYIRQIPDREVHGISLVENFLSQNKVLSSFEVRDLNRDPRIANKQFYHAAVMAFGMNYLTRPLELLTSVYDSLQNGGKLVVVCSDNCFVNEKSPHIWRQFSGARRKLAADYMQRSGFRIIDATDIDQLQYWDIDSFMIVGQKLELPK